jgi:hypothetical protein
MLGLISNPKKSLVVNYSCQSIMSIYPKILDGMLLNNKIKSFNYKLESIDDILKQITLSCDRTLCH